MIERVPGTITKAISENSYAFEVPYDNSRIDAAINALEKALEKKNNLIARLQTEQTYHRDWLEYYKAELSQVQDLIADYQNISEPTPEQQAANSHNEAILDDLLKTIQDVEKALALTNQKLSSAKAERSGLSLKIRDYQSARKQKFESVADSNLGSLSLAPGTPVDIVFIGGNLSMPVILQEQESSAKLYSPLGKSEFAVFNEVALHTGFAKWGVNFVVGTFQYVNSIYGTDDDKGKITVTPTEGKKNLTGQPVYPRGLREIEFTYNPNILDYQDGDLALIEITSAGEYRARGWYRDPREGGTTLKVWRHSFYSEPWDIQEQLPKGEFVQASIGNFHAVALRPNGVMVAWGDDRYGKLNVPPFARFKKVQARQHKTFGLTTSGYLMGWGKNDNEGEFNFPSGPFIDFDVGGYGFTGLAMRPSGEVVYWGRFEDGYFSFTKGTDDFPAGKRAKLISAGEADVGLINQYGSLEFYGERGDYSEYYENDSYSFFPNFLYDDYVSLSINGRFAAAVTASGFLEEAWVKQTGGGDWSYAEPNPPPQVGYSRVLMKGARGFAQEKESGLVWTWRWTTGTAYVGGGYLGSTGDNPQRLDEIGVVHDMDASDYNVIFLVDRYIPD